MGIRLSRAWTRGASPVAPLAAHVELLRGLARRPVQDRRGAVPGELDHPVARGLAASTFVGHAGIEVRITEAGSRALAELDAPSPISVYDVPEVRDELKAFLAAWLPAVGEQDARPFKANLAFLLDLVVEQGLQLELRRLRGALRGPNGAGASDRGAAETVLAVLGERTPGRQRGRSSRSADRPMDGRGAGARQ